MNPRAGVMKVGATRTGSRPASLEFDAGDQDPVEIYEAFERMLAAWPDARVPLKRGEHDPGAVCGCGAVHGGWTCSHCTRSAAPMEAGETGDAPSKLWLFRMRDWAYVRCLEFPSVAERDQFITGYSAIAAKLGNDGFFLADNPGGPGAGHPACREAGTAPEAGRAALLRRVGDILRSDWSMTYFDGRDCKRWISTALDGDADALAELGEDLRRIEDDE